MVHTMNTILFPTDFSENSNHAFRFAKMMAGAKKAKLILLYTYNLPLVAPMNTFTNREQTLSLIDNDLREAAHIRMKAYTKELDLMSDDYTVLIREGNTVDIVVDCCKEEKVDLIVMGTKGRTNNRDFLIGSITAKLIEKVNIPLLAIPESATIHPFKKIVFATDFINDSSSEIQKVIDFAKLNDSSLTFLHVKTDSEKGEKGLGELQKTIERNSQQDLGLEIIHANNIEKGVDCYLKENETNLLVLSNHTKSFFEKLFHKSISKEMILHSKIPLLIFSKEIHPIVFF